MSRRSGESSACEKSDWKRESRSSSGRRGRSHRYDDNDDSSGDRDRSYSKRRRERSRDRSRDRGRDESGRRERHNHDRSSRRERSPDAADRKPIVKEQPNFGLSGKLAAETNTYRGVVIKYSEPPEATVPTKRWRLYPFKGEKMLPVMYVHRQSAYLVGRDRKICDFPVDHPSCSKQHAVLQYRAVQFERGDGSTGKRVRPYLIDLESANGTSINGIKMEPKRYYELFEKDIVRFGFSTREYVLLQEESKDNNDADDEVGSESEVKNESSSPPPPPLPPQ